MFVGGRGEVGLGGGVRGAQCTNASMEDVCIQINMDSGQEHVYVDFFYFFIQCKCYFFLGKEAI